MAFLDRLFHKNDLPVFTDGQIVAVADGRVIPLEEVEDPVFAKETMGQTIAFAITGGEIVSPANGRLEVLFPTGHAFAVRTADGRGIMVHIGIDTVDLNGRGFKTFANQGDTVRAGQKIVSVDLETLREAGCSSTTMIIMTETNGQGQRENFAPAGTAVCRGQVINRTGS